MPSPDKKQVIDSLSAIERQLLPQLKKTTEVQKLAKLARMDEDSVRRALLWLSNKGIVALTTRSEELVDLDENGRLYKDKGLPEKIILHALVDGKNFTLKELSLKTGLPGPEMSACMGILKGRAALEMIRDDANNLIMRLTKAGEELAKKETLEEKFFKNDFPVPLANLKPEEKAAVEHLLRRKSCIKIVKQKELVVDILPFGKEILKEKLDFKNVEDALTPAMLESGEWRKKRFRSFDIESPVPPVTGGRRHPFIEVCNIIRDIFLEMGFQEMSGPWVETAFWCMDSMWIPQDHPARDVQDTFFLGMKGDLPDKNLVRNVKEAHETGAGTGSTGHGGVWSEDIARELLLRTHTTATTFRMFGIGKLNQDCKYFYVGNNFRNETVDATHLSEFWQAEGFIMGDGLTLSDLMGFVKEFYAKLGITKIRFKPTYNPYTEPSMEAHYYDEQKGRWYALINSGIFRQESLAPFGIKKSVIAWGMGASRIAAILTNKRNLKELVGATCDFGWIGEHTAPQRRL